MDGEEVPGVEDVPVLVEGEKAKWKTSLQRKIQEVRELNGKMAPGEMLEKNQIEKVDGLGQLGKELEELEVPGE